MRLIQYQFGYDENLNLLNGWNYYTDGALEALRTT